MRTAAPLVRASSLIDEVARASEELGLAARSRELDQHPEFPWPEFRELGRRRLLGLTIPRALGGREAPLGEAGAALYELSYRSGTTFAKLALQPEFSSVLGRLGRPEQIERYFRPLLDGELLVGNQITEPGAGSDLRGIAMRAEPVPEGHRLSGTKSQAAFALDASAALVYARPKAPDGSVGEIQAFLVPQEQDGIRRRSVPDLGERWMRRGEVTYRSVLVPSDHRVGPERGVLDALKQELTHERLLLAAIYLGVGRSSFDEAVEFAGVRQTFGRPIARHEAVGFPLVEDWARLDAAELYVGRALDRAERGEPVDAEAALAKWMATDVALTAIDHALQFAGGRGYSSELPHEQRWRDVRSGALAHGPSEVLHLIAAGALWPSGPTSAPTGRA